MIEIFAEAASYEMVYLRLKFPILGRKTIASHKLLLHASNTYYYKYRQLSILDKI